MRYANARICLFSKLRKEKYDISLIYHIMLMDIFLYIIIFIIGTFFGSFFTLAVYRIPKKEDILIKHSYCPNCNHKLGFFDLFPVFSYIFLGGKCRYCKDKIRPRYLILELLSGFAFLFFALAFKVSVFNISNQINFIATLIYSSILFIVAGIDKEKVIISKSVIFCGYILEIIYMIYQYTLGIFNVYQYVIYLILLVVVLVLDNIFTMVTMIKKYYIQVLYLALYIIIFGGAKIFILSVILALLIIAIHNLLNKNKKAPIPVGFYLSISNLIIILIANILINYII